MRKVNLMLSVLLILSAFSMTGCKSDATVVESSEEITAESISEELETAENVTQSDCAECETVYRTITGECYHTDECIYLKSKISLSLKEAANMGLRPCSRCSPPNLQ